MFGKICASNRNGLSGDTATPSGPKNLQQFFGFG